MTSRVVHACGWQVDVGNARVRWEQPCRGSECPFSSTRKGRSGSDSVRCVGQWSANCERSQTTASGGAIHIDSRCLSRHWQRQYLSISPKEHRALAVHDPGEPTNCTNRREEKSNNLEWPEFNRVSAETKCCAERSYMATDGSPPCSSSKAGLSARIACNDLASRRAQGSQEAKATGPFMAQRWLVRAASR